MMLHMAAAAKAVGNRQRFFRLGQTVAPVRRLSLQIKARDNFSVCKQCDAAQVIGSIGCFDSFFKCSVLGCDFLGCLYTLPAQAAGTAFTHSFPDRHGEELIHAEHRSPHPVSLFLGAGFAQDIFPTLHNLVDYARFNFCLLQLLCQFSDAVIFVVFHGYPQYWDMS